MNAKQVRKISDCSTTDKDATYKKQLKESKIEITKGITYSATQGRDSLFITLDDLIPCRIPLYNRPGHCNTIRNELKEHFEKLDYTVEIVPDVSSSFADTKLVVSW